MQSVQLKVSSTFNIVEEIISVFIDSYELNSSPSMNI